MVLHALPYATYKLSRHISLSGKYMYVIGIILINSRELMVDSSSSSVDGQIVVQSCHGMFIIIIIIHNKNKLSITFYLAILSQVLQNTYLKPSVVFTGGGNYSKRSFELKQ